MNNYLLIIQETKLGHLYNRALVHVNAQAAVTVCIRPTRDQVRQNLSWWEGVGHKGHSQLRRNWQLMAAVKGRVTFFFRAVASVEFTPVPAGSPLSVDILVAPSRFSEF